MASFTFCEYYEIVSLILYLEEDGIQLGFHQRHILGTFHTREDHHVHREGDRLFSAALNAVIVVPHLSRSR